MKLHHTGLRASLAMTAIALAAQSTTAAADSTTATMPVAATVIATCVTVATPLVFGNYSAAGADPTDADARVTVTCTPGAAYEVALNAGQNSADASARKLKGAGDSDFLDYSIYSDASRTQVWGDTSGVNTVSGSGLGAEQVLSVYGRMPAQQASPLGAYVDVVTVTVSY
ncbi:MAG TPA: spore coat U domain-containing protein [Solimonas sp.]|nr:spore coat U domain-containing protein [Solimonas sp.]